MKNEIQKLEELIDIDNFDVRLSWKSLVELIDKTKIDTERDFVAMHLSAGNNELEKLTAVRAAKCLENHGLGVRFVIADAVNEADLRDIIKEYKLDPETLISMEFDISNSAMNFWILSTKDWEQKILTAGEMAKKYPNLQNIVYIEINNL